MSKTPRHYSPYDAPMWQSIEEGQMKLQRCRQTGTFYYPPGPACPESLSFDVEWAPISGKGKILSWTVFHRQYLPAYPAPHLVVAVALEEGPIMIGYMDHDSLPGLKLDRGVAMRYVEHPDGYRVPKFVLE
ncbi:Zn-ribbon domain-containing OB-fold protein [Bordetella petrii]|uniref:OB-fold domain-containing protein n=1 Tax=Bordetella petrii TaxID=94624 RepID=A0ABT7W2E4_9BORD|nr:OB-fold domain-containing protein [Bordetella petrii]MDM9559356.1 OB-fold domain-containing protein [Bordetella petrii]